MAACCSQEKERTMDIQPRRTDNIIYGPQMDISIDERGLGRMIFEKMKEHADRVFQINTHTNEEQTYREINTKLVRIALEMRRRGIKANDVVLTCSDNTMDTILPIYSTLYLNAVTVTLDPTINVRDSTHLLKTVSPKIIFVQQDAVDLIEKASADLEKKPEIVVMGSHKNHARMAEFLEPHPDENTFVPDDVEDVRNISNIFFSSGTTGLPKAVLHTHYSMSKACRIIRFAFPYFETSLFYTSFYWISAFLLTTTTIFAGGKRLYNDTFTPETFLKFVEMYKVTVAFLSSTYGMKFTEANTKNAKTNSLRDFMVGGSTISETHIINLRKYFPHAGIRVGYGQTETGGVVTVYTEKTDHFLKAKPSSCGLPFINVVLKVVNLETGKVVGPMQRGEIRVKSDSTFRGYLSLNSTQEESFDEEGFLKTGDIGYFDEENCLYFCDRIKEMFKYQSWHVVPASVEVVIYTHPAVLEAIVVGIPHALDDNHPLALVVLREGYDVTEEELLVFVNARLSEREKLRAGLRIVKQLPKTCTGKIARPHVRQIAIDGDFRRLIN